LAAGNAHSLKMKAYDFDEPALARNGTAQRTHVDKSLERLGWLMDDLFRVPVLGWRFGLDALVGLIPGFGDVARLFLHPCRSRSLQGSEDHHAPHGDEHRHRLCGRIAAGCRRLS
jgi:uncharacterized protein DUF4112